MPVLLFSTAILINLDIWIYMYIKVEDVIDQMKNVQTNKEEQLKRQNKIHGVIAFLILIVWVYIIWIIIDSIIFKSYNSWLNHMATGLMFIFIGLIFGIVGIMSNMKLYKYFRPFYNVNKTQLWIATSGLSLPLIVRGSLNVAASFKVYMEFEDRN